MLRNIAVLTLVSAAAPAHAEHGAELNIRTFSPINAPLVYSDYAGPITISQTNRSMSARATADYGYASVAGSQRLTSLVDGRSGQASAVISRWSDSFDLSFAGVNASAAFISFFIDVAAPAPKPTAKGFNGSSVEMTAEWSIALSTPRNDGNGFLSGVAEGSVTTRDTPTSPPKSATVLNAKSLGVDNNAFSFFTAISAVASPRVGFDRFLLTAQFRPGQYHIQGTSRCSMFQTSFRIGDYASGSCGASVLEWGGLAGIYLWENASVNFDSASGYDYNFPYTPVPLNRASIAGLASSAAAVPEPATWAMLIAGFGIVGAVARGRRVVAF